MRGGATAVAYDQKGAQESHSVAGAREALDAIFKGAFPRSVVDFGCGNGSWLKASLDRGAEAVLGIDGAEIPSELMHVADEMVQRADLNLPLELGRRFELVLCLETAEHLKPASSGTIIDTLVRHGELILFSAAAPGQQGDGHINCRPPAFWQGLFNDRGFVCSDAVRWAIWHDPRIEPWYRQNLMIVTRDESCAGSEPRIALVLHPEVIDAEAYLQGNLEFIERGGLPLRCYLTMPVKALGSKLGRNLGRHFGINIRRVATLHPEVDSADALLRENLKFIEGGALPLGWYMITPAKALRSKLGRLLQRRSHR